LQKSVPQHSCVWSQLHPVLAQQLRSVAHSPLQQKLQLSLGCDIGIVPVSKQAMGPQRPWWQVSPSQQSLSLVQTAALAPQSQVPLWQPRRVQQSALVEHVWPLSAQTQLPAWHVPPQQSPSALQPAPGRAHARQVPPRQAKLSQH